MEDKRNTIDVNEQVSKCESLVELQEILSKNSNYFEDRTRTAVEPRRI